MAKRAKAKARKMKEYKCYAVLDATTGYLSDVAHSRGDAARLVCRYCDTVGPARIARVIVREVLPKRKGVRK